MAELKQLKKKLNASKAEIDDLHGQIKGFHDRENEAKKRVEGDDDSRLLELESQLESSREQVCMAVLGPFFFVRGEGVLGFDFRCSRGAPLATVARLRRCR